MVEGDPSTKIAQKNRLIAIVGPTASGKTQRAVDIARHLDGEIISGDSRQVYRDMDLGTGKDLEEYGNIPYHLIDIVDAGEKYNLHKYITDFREALTIIQGKGKQPILCGGSGMYVENALSGVVLPEVPENPKLRDRLKDFPLEDLTKLLSLYKPLHNTTDVDTRQRAIRAIEIAEYYRRNPEKAETADRKNVKPLEAVIVGIDIPRELRREKISIRLRKRLEQGMVEEIRNLLGKGIKPVDLIYYGLEYKYLTLYVIGQITYDQLFKELEIAIHQFSKRQMTWFRGMEKRGFHINWLPYDLSREEFISRVYSLLKD